VRPRWWEVLVSGHVRPSPTAYGRPCPIRAQDRTPGLGAPPMVPEPATVERDRTPVRTDERGCYARRS
jgi:hypothetical protein